MRHYGPEPPWRGYSRHYGEWVWVKPDPDSWFEEQGYWRWHPPSRPGSFLGMLTRELDKVRDQLREELNRPAFPNLADLVNRPTVLE